MINIKNDELETLLIYAQRYAIGRIRHAPTEVSELVRKYMPYATTGALNVLIQDIEQQADVDMLGDVCDKKMWLALLDTLKNERDRRQAIDGE